MSTWAEQALEATFEAVRDGRVLEQIAVTEAWTDGPDAFCVLYSAPFRRSDPVVGIRCERGDSNWDVTGFLADLAPKVAAGITQAPTTAQERAQWLRTSDDPAEYGSRLAEYISEPLGVFGNHLRVDSAALGWWGTLNADLPNRPT